MATQGGLVPGATFANDFRVVRRIGKGGMGTVYEVEQLSTGKHRALKLMRSDLVSEPDMQEKFANEARVGSRVESDHVVEVIAAGFDAASEQPWLVMELLEGQALGDHLRSQPGERVDLHEARSILKQVCHALGEAHNQGIVHRDLKPENIFRARSRRVGESFTIKVLDFGIAKVLAGSQSMASMAIGSPAWMAIEQIDDDGSISPATDVWPLGLLAFWLLTGKLFWKTASNSNPSAARYIREIMAPVPLAFGARARAKGNPPAAMVRCLVRSLRLF